VFDVKKCQEMKKILHTLNARSNTRASHVLHNNSTPSTTSAATCPFHLLFFFPRPISGLIIFIPEAFDLYTHFHRLHLQINKLTLLHLRPAGNALINRGTGPYASKVTVGLIQAQYLLSFIRSAVSIGTNETK